MKSYLEEANYYLDLARQIDKLQNEDLNIIAFYLYQAINNLIKSALTSKGRPIPKTFDLVLLIQDLDITREFLEKYQTILEYLTPFTFYPSDNLPKIEFGTTRNMISKVEDLFSELLNLDCNRN